MTPNLKYFITFSEISSIFSTRRFCCPNKAGGKSRAMIPACVFSGELMTTAGSLQNLYRTIEYRRMLKAKIVKKRHQAVSPKEIN